MTELLKKIRNELIFNSNSESDIRVIESIINYKFDKELEDFLLVLGGFINWDLPYDIIFKNKDIISKIELVPEIIESGILNDDHYIQFYNLVKLENLIPLCYSGIDELKIIHLDTSSGKIIECKSNGENLLILSDSINEFISNLMTNELDIRFMSKDKNEYDSLVKEGYKFVHNPYTGGDDDFLIVDKESKRFIYAENGDYPFCSIRDLNENYKDKSLEYLMKIQR